MKKEDLNKANEIIRSIDCLNTLRYKIFLPYPSFFSRLKFNKRDQFCGFYEKVETISFAQLDEKTNKMIKDAIIEIIDIRTKELNEEINLL